MCGIFGYVGKKRDATKAVFLGLKKLDYRGYDSWGIGVVKKNKILLTKHIGVVNKKLLNLPKSQIGIGHTRWATNGSVTKLNAHPHKATDGSFILAQNGVMENYEVIKKQLTGEGFKFVSQTDTEVIVHLIESEKKKVKNIVTAIRNSFNKCRGRNTIIVLTNDGTVIAARNGSPLVLGFSTGFGEMYFSSDTLSFAPYVENTITIKNGEMVIFKNKSLGISRVSDGQEMDFESEPILINKHDSGKDGFSHFMIKEISEQPKTILQIIENSKNGNLTKLAKVVRRSDNVYVVGSGTAGAAAAQTAYYLRTFGAINAIALIGAEAHDYYNLFKKGDLIIAPSQSGETADVLEVLEIAKNKSVKIASLVNMPGSLMTSMSDYKFMTSAGPEICVLSTKVFVAQIVWGYLLGKIVENKYEEGIQNLQSLSRKMRDFLGDKRVINNIKHLAHKLVKKEDVLIMAKGQNLQIAKEGMIKIIEGAYIHAHTISAGDLKHYAITLITKGFPVIAIASDDSYKSDLLNAIHEIEARGANIILVSEEKMDDVYYQLKTPKTGEAQAIMNIVPLQLLAYYLALLKGNNIDKPRNIAKSVTVK